jgi:5'-deoxynucleotidase YfbR-like HD superfamily hydrolase
MIFMPLSTLLDAIQALKLTPRSGWIHAGVSLADVESVAEHSFGVAAVSLILSEKLLESGVHIDVPKTLKMAILHDLSESLTFDISKRYLEFLGERGQRIKREIEHSANRKLLSNLPSRLKRESSNILVEHETGTTIEAQTVIAADRIDLLLQLYAYHRRGFRDKILTEMREKVKNEIRATKNPVFISTLNSINE